MKELNFIQVESYKRRFVFVGIFCAAVFIIVICYFWGLSDYLTNLVKTVFSNKSIQIGSGQTDVDLLTRVSEIVVLPKNERPTIATVVDPAQLRGDFFAKAKKGDRVLIFKIAGKAILYDPIANKVVEVAPILLDTPTPTPVPTP